MSKYYVTEYQNQITDEFVVLNPPEVIHAEQGCVQCAISKYTELYPDRWTFHGAVTEESKGKIQVD